MQLKLQTLELFGGIGAPRRSLEKLEVDIKSIDYVEILRNAVTAYGLFFPYIYKPQDIRAWNLNVDLLVHGSPCVDFSKAGRNDIRTGRSLLYERSLEIIGSELAELPKYVVWENVKGLISKKHSVHFNHYLTEMERIGYANYYDVLNAKDFGIPQNRERVIVISIRNDIDKVFNFQSLEKKKMEPVSAFLDENNVMPWIDVGTVFHEFTNFYTFPRKTDGKLINGNYNRCWKIDKYVGCISASVVTKISKVEDGRLYYRELSIYECGRLMGFETQDVQNLVDNGIPTNDIYHLFGNSIVVPMMEAVFKELLF